LLVLLAGDHSDRVLLCQGHGQGLLIFPSEPVTITFMCVFFFPLLTKKFVSFYVCRTTVYMGSTLPNIYPKT